MTSLLRYHLVITNIAMENPKNKWRILAGKIVYFYGQFSMAMLNNQRVYFIWDIQIIFNVPLLNVLFVGDFLMKTSFLVDVPLTRLIVDWFCGENLHRTPLFLP